MRNRMRYCGELNRGIHTLVKTMFLKLSIETSHMKHFPNSMITDFPSIQFLVYEPRNKRFRSTLGSNNFPTHPKSQVFYVTCPIINTADKYPTIDRLCTFAAYSSSQLDVFRHNCDTFRVNGTQVCIFKESNQISFARFL